MNPDAQGRFMLDAVVDDGAGRGVMFARGDTVPTDADTGYAVGCLFIDTDGGASTTLYVNEGSVTSCSFKAATIAT